MILRCHKRCIFILYLCFVFFSCAAKEAVNPAAFYRGLILEQDDGEKEEAWENFAEGLGSGNSLIREAAAERLMLPVLRGEYRAAEITAALDRALPGVKTEKTAAENTRGTAENTLRAAALYALGRFEEAGILLDSVNANEETVWNRALRLALRWIPAEEKEEPAGEETRKAARDFFFREAAGGEAFLWAFETAPPSLFTVPDFIALDGRLAVSGSNFNAGLTAFRELIEMPATDTAEILFLRYPELLSDLGRCFQFAGSGEEGIELFLNWNAGLDDNAARDILRYRLLYFAGRIARQRQLLERAYAYFEEAFYSAPDREQQDACVWYILDMALSTGTDAGIAAVERWIDRWNDKNYFVDILDRLAQKLTVERRWDDTARILKVLENRGPSVSTAQYGAIMGRVRSLSPAGKEEAEAYFRISGEAAGRSFDPVSFYYRSAAAAFLGLPFLPPELKEQPEQGGNAQAPSENMEFLLGFFKHNAASLALPEIRRLETELSIGELRTLAEELNRAERYHEAIRLTGAYIARPEYVLDIADLFLSYPRAFTETVESRAAEKALEAALLFGLIRTESAFQSGIVSRAGAVGLMQLMADTASEMAGRIARRGGPRYSVEDDLRDPLVNIHLGTEYLSYLFDRMEREIPALLAYNGGMGRVRRWLRGSEQGDELFLETVEYNETRNYGRRVLGAAEVYKFLYYREPH
ncbi:MAG: lytic transglycosylase domain-containing protein [Treponema sp.]|jgi:soluble lytic murein transglycosylase|nr:lytic transglycosylase domain-containing protein [Treponema sp.]